MSIASPAARMCDIFKACRSQRLTAKEIAEQVGAGMRTAYDWIDELIEQGFLVRIQGEADGSRGCPPATFTLSRHWGGTADV